MQRYMDRKSRHKYLDGHHREREKEVERDTDRDIERLRHG